MKKKYVIGIDGGTESVRVSVYDLLGNQVGWGATEYKTYHPQSGWAEQDPKEWWDALINSMRIAMEKSRINKEQVIGIGIDTTCATIVLCNNEGEAIRPALLWMDIRAHKEADFISATKHDALKYNGYGKVSPEWMVCKALWLKNNEPENYNEADKFVDYVDWYTFKLTGRFTGSISTTTYRWHYNSENKDMQHSFYKEIGIEDVLHKTPDDILNLGDKIGGLTKEAAEELGLLVNTPVAQGGVDALNGLIGLGITQPGKIALITGSSHNVYSLTTRELHSKDIMGTFPNAVLPGLNLAEAGQSSSGSTIKWFRTNFCKDLEVEAVENKTSVYEMLNEKAKYIKPGSDGLIVLDYWQGNRSPHVDPNVRGLISGLSLNHTREHIYRAIIEGIAYGTDNNIRNLRANGIEAKEIYAAGGATNSELFLQIHSDVSNVIIHVPEDNQVSSLGSAILATVAAGVYDSIDTAVRNMVKYKDKVITPNQENHEIYQLYAGQYRKAYGDFHKWMWENNRINKENL